MKQEVWHEMNKPGKLDKYFELIFPQIRKYGFSNLKIDEILKIMNISKATFYKYFASKDDLIGQIITDYAAHVVDVDQMVLDETVPFEARFRKIYEQSVLSILIMTDVFFADLKQTQPGLLSVISSAQLSRCDLLQRFYQSGYEQNIFNPVNPVVFFLQDDAVIRRLIDPMILNHYDTTLKQHLLDFYQLKKYTLFKAEQLYLLNDAAMEQKIGEILRRHAI
jgi:AcrR family transcriptional regulator